MQLTEVKVLECKVLGSLEVRVAGDAQLVGSRKQQVVMALLLMYANRAVSLDELVDELWPTSPPASAVANVNSYVANLRRLLKRAGDKAERINRNGSSFQLRAGADELDLFAFEEEMRRGREAFARGDLELSVTLLAAAWDRWRGPLIAGLPRGPLLAARCAAVEEERLNLAEDLAEMWVRRREPTRAAALLRGHVSANPLRERGHATLVQALYQLGDIAGALSAYTAARQAMVEHLGIEPGDELQRLHSAVLRRDPTLDAGAPNLTSGPIRAVAAPRELPAEAGYFAGRTAEVAQACEILVSRGERSRHRAATLVLYGRGGVGKSALAVKVAHKVAEDFPDGQFYVNLYPGFSPLPLLDVLCRLLRSLGVTETELPDSETDAAARFRTLTANGRMLLVLDNASDPAQIIPLLPANGGCAVIVTSRQALAAVDADGHLNVGGLPASDGIALLRAITHDVEIDPEVAARIVDACDELPLAVRIAAGRLIHRPDLTPEELAERLANERQRLDELELGSLAVRACIRIGYDAVVARPGCVEQVAARAFRLLGLLNVPNVQLGVVAAMLAEPDLQLVRRALDHLVDAQLLAPLCGGRFQLHDLVRLFAAEQMATETAHARAAALRRALAYYIGSANRANDILRAGRRIDLGEPAIDAKVPLAQFSSSDLATAWVDAELPNMLAAAEQASALDCHDRRFVLWICNSAWHGLYVRLEHRKASDLSRLVLEVGERFADREMVAWGHLFLGRTAADLGNIQSASEHTELARTIFRELSHAEGHTRTLNSLGVLAKIQGRPSEAFTYLTECLTLTQEYGMRGLESTVRVNLGSLCCTLGRWSEAMSHFQQGLSIRSSLGDRSGMGAVSAQLATLYCHDGDLTEALRLVDQAIAYCREVGDRVHLYLALAAGAEAHRRRGDNAQALALAEESLLLARQVGYRHAEATALHQCAEILAVTGQCDKATRLRTEAAATADASFVDPMMYVLFDRYALMPTAEVSHGWTPRSNPEQLSRPVDDV